MYNNLRKYWRIFMVVALLLVALTALTTDVLPVQEVQAKKGPDPLAFVPENFETVETVNITLDGEPLEVTKYLVTYVANPVEMASSHTGPATDPTAWHKMYIYVPETAADDQATAIIMNVSNGGWLSSPVGDIFTDRDGNPVTEFVSDSDTDKTGAALAAGYVIANVGTRSRGLIATDGTYPGHAPAVVVDAKAAIRYLKYNDKIMPGSADKIVITGTSGGGGLSVAVAASGNSPDYYPYLKAIGAAGFNPRGKSTLTDDVFATIAYCPITDLDHADIAYEWQYSATRLLDPAYTDGPFDEQVSADLAAQYPAYLKSLKLRLEDGTPLTVDTMPGAIEALVKAGTEKAMANGETVPDLGEDWTFTQRDGSKLVVTNDWLDVDNDADTVVSIDYGKYLEFVTTTAALKTAPAFENYGTSLQYRMNESNLSGDETTEYNHWLAWSWENDIIPDNGVGLDDTGLTFKQFMRTNVGRAVVRQMKMINPMPYLLSRRGDSAPYWYVRHGIRDRDTSFAVEAALFYAIQNDRTVKDANYALAYMQPHGGNYDVQEAYGWLAGILAPQAEHGNSLVFDVNDFTEETVDGISFRAYRDIVYVKNPVNAYAENRDGTITEAPAYQQLNVYVPLDIALKDYKKDDTPIFFPNCMGGYNPGLACEPDRDEIKTALAEGYVVVSPGVRGRTNYDPDAGEFNGKAPAVIVDLKAAVRYLRFNDKRMPGDAEKIISSGTSGGGAISTLLGSTGNSKDYEPYLKAIGAAKERDDIFATNAYCPITNLDNADTAYEWLLYGINDYYFLGGGTMTGDQLIVSKELKDAFPAYLNSLKLYAHEPKNDKGKGHGHAPERVKKGVALTLDEDGEGTFKDYVQGFIYDSAQTALDKGTDLSGYDWITIEDGVVTDIDWDGYLTYAGKGIDPQRMKPAPAFDGIYAPSWENNEFGTATISDQHFTQYSYETEYSTYEMPLVDQGIVKMMNPMDYIDAPGATSSHYWRIRHGAQDEDTALPIPIILATKLMNTGHEVDFAIPWDQGHGGNYDLDELFDWIETITADQHHQNGNGHK